MPGCAKRCLTGSPIARTFWRQERNLIVSAAYRQTEERRETARNEVKLCNCRSAESMEGQNWASPLPTAFGNPGSHSPTASATVHIYKVPA